MPRHLLLIALSLWIGASNACSLSGLEQALRFRAGESRLPAAEVAGLAHWNAEMKARFPNGGTYGVFLRSSDPLSRTAAGLRLESLQDALQAVGVAGDKIEYSELETARREYQQSGIAKPTREAAIVFQPACPHPCCPGPQPSK